MFITLIVTTPLDYEMPPPPIPQSSSSWLSFHYLLYVISIYKTAIIFMRRRGEETQACDSIRARGNKLLFINIFT